MDIERRLAKARTDVLREIAESAREGRSQEVRAAAQKLAAIEALMERHQVLLRDLAELEAHDARQDPGRAPAELAVRTPSSPWSTDELAPSITASESGKGAGRAIRTVFLTKAERLGVHLAYVKGTIYATPAGRKVGIAAATERNTDRWLLSLPGRGFEQAVLLCRSRTGDLVEIFLPGSFFDEHGARLAASGSQMKINVARRGRDYVILVPGAGGVNVTRFVGDYSSLK